MKKLFVLLAVTLLVLAVSCDTKNVGTGTDINRGPVNVQVAFAPVAGGAIEGGADGTATLTWQSGIAPFTASINFGGGCTVNVPAGTPVTSPYVVNVTFVNASITDTAQYTWTATVTDSVTGSVPGTGTGTFDVLPTPNQNPVIDNVAYAGGVLTVDVSDPDAGDTLTVTVTEPAGLSVDATSKVASQVSGTATFNWSATDVVLGGSGNPTITVDDGNGGSATHNTTTVTVAGIQVADGAIGAVASPSSATAGGDPVTIIVIAGAFPAAAQFNYCNGVGVTVDDGGDYVDGTLNVGAPGGGQKDVDGIWAEMTSPVNDFLLPSDFMIAPDPVDGQAGVIRLDFNVTPIGGNDLETGGMIFNFGMTFSTAGTYTLGFQEFQDVKRTYYSDSTAAEFNWTDITNAGLPNEITVN